MQTFIATHESGYLLLTAGPGLGKSAFIADRVSHADPPPAYHFIKRGMGNWDDPDAFLVSLTTQLQRTYQVPSVEPGLQPTPTMAFLTTLQHVSHQLQDGQKVVLYLDGLDEAFGPTGRFAQVALPGILPRLLPPGIIIVLTARPGEFLQWLADPMLCETLDLDPSAKDNQADIHTYLQHQNQSRQLGWDAAFLGQLQETTEGFFAVAVLYAHEQPPLLDAWRKHPERIPRGLTGWLIAQWQRVEMAAKGKGLQEQTVREVLGLLATAREPLSREHLLAFLQERSVQTEGESEGPPLRWLNLATVRQHFETVLELTAEFFDPLDPTQGAAAPYRFFHTRFPEFIAERLTVGERQDCHRLLAHGCARAARDAASVDVVRDYALQHRFAHLIAAQEWEAVMSTFAEAGFIVAMSQHCGFAAVHRAAQTAAQQTHATTEWRVDFSLWERFLRWRIERLRYFPAAYAQEVANEFLPTASTTWTKSLQPLADEFFAASGSRLRKLSGPPSLGEGGHVGWVRSVAFSGDGQRVVSGSYDNSVKVWDAATGQCVADCRGHTDFVESVAFSGDGQQVVSSGMDDAVKVWDAAMRRCVADCRGHTGGVLSVVVSGDGQWVVLCSEDGTVKVWDAATGQCVADCHGHVGWVRSVAFSGDGQRVVSALIPLPSRCGMRPRGSVCRYCFSTRQ